MLTTISCCSATILDKVERYAKMKGYYYVMDKAPIRSLTDIEKYIHSQGYQCHTVLRILLSQAQLSISGQL